MDYPIQGASPIRHHFGSYFASYTARYPYSLSSFRTYVRHRRRAGRPPGAAGSAAPARRPKRKAEGLENDYGDLGGEDEGEDDSDFRKIHSRSRTLSTDSMLTAALVARRLQYANSKQSQSLPTDLNRLASLQHHDGEDRPPTAERFERSPSPGLKLPREIRREMLATELPDELRRGLLRERRSPYRIASGQLRQQAKADVEADVVWRGLADAGFGGYHYHGW